MDLEFQETIQSLTTEIDRIAPNMRAVDRLDDVENKLKETAKEFDNARREAKSAKDAFTKIKQERYVCTHLEERPEESGQGPPPWFLRTFLWTRE